MYHPASTNLLEQWFELYNAGTNAVNMTGWRITKDVDFNFPSNTVLPTGGYLVVAADQATFAANHPTVTNFVSGWVGILNNEVKLEDNLGQVINDVSFEHEGD